MFKRIAIFLGVNIAIILTVTMVLHLLGIQPYLTAQGLNIGALVLFCLIWGMVGSFISLLLSKMIAKWMLGVRILEPTTTSAEERKLISMVYTLSKKAGLETMPEVGIFESAEINAFATGATKSSSLVAVSTALLEKMNTDQVEGVIGHELAHIANGDMVTMALLQGVINAFVMFLARVIAYAIMQVRGEEEGEGFSQLAYFLTVIALEIVFMIFGTMIISWYSRRREFSADRDGAKIAGKAKMLAALEKLQATYEAQQQEADPRLNSARAMMMSGKKGWIALFATHPPLEERIAALQADKLIR
jgi:heat shock protein HtpX